MTRLSFRRVGIIVLFVLLVVGIFVVTWLLFFQPIIRVTTNRNANVNGVTGGLPNANVNRVTNGNVNDLRRKIDALGKHVP